MWINKLWGKIRNQIVNENETRPLTEAPSPRSDKFLIVGLGNTGRKYQRNRHNIGFMIVDRLAALHGIDVNRVQNKTLVGNGRIANQSVILAKPQTMMNLSGDAVGPIANYYNIPPANVLVIYDELDLPLGTIRLREKGGAGGHNGMKSIINHLGNDFPRLRLGIGRPPGRMPPAAYVLQDFGKEDEPVVVELIDTAVKAVAAFLTDGINLAMSKYNKNINTE
ncbi:MAG: aminoacyl-tRNA hydrolase [Anaerolineales bacterium]|nr:aminoacyl-tRNA hydrolase [Anaerolineales bacterium]